ncbi:MAG: TIM barrel protein [Paracoccus sp. (in: a-proteobacteria)]|nr:TIM barrel protein [Paracoccus sp. (in: a-proteobacteria)]
MPRFSANLGFLWAELPLPDAVRAAHEAGFNAVECHWPYDHDPAAVRAALEETGLVMLGLNTRRGQAGENGLAALPDRKAEARAEIDRAITYAREIGCRSVHVMAGITDSAGAGAVFRDNLAYACDQAEGLKLLIEPLNRYDAPGYFLHSAWQAADIIAAVGRDNLALMFDCYHLQIQHGDLTRLLAEMAPLTGHIQFASVPDRGPPDQGELCYDHIFAAIDASGWTRPLGAEYRPRGKTADSLGWMDRWRAPDAHPAGQP